MGTVTDSTFTDGMAGLGVNGYQTDQFDNLSVTALGSATPTGPIIAGDNTAKCVDDNSDSSANGTKIECGTATGTAAQNWTIETDGTVRINGSCMDITGAGTTNGTLVELWTCNGGANQQWLPVNRMLVNPVSGRCLDDPGFTTRTAPNWRSGTATAARTNSGRSLSGGSSPASGLLLDGSSRATEA